MIYLTLNTAWDVPIYKEIQLKKLPSYEKTVGICKVKADGSNAAGIKTYNNIANMESCRDLCIDYSEPCKAYHFNTNPDTQLLNCAIFIETR